MRWVIFAIFVGFVVTLQTAFAPRFELLGARPDWLIITVVFIALHAPQRDAVIGAWLIGACADLMTIERFGLIALGYLLVAVVVAGIRETLFRHRWTTHLIVTIIAGVLVRAAWMGYRRAIYDTNVTLMADLTTDVVLVTLYTAAWAPIAHMLLLKIAVPLGFKKPRYSYAGLHRTGGGHV